MRKIFYLFGQLTDADIEWMLSKGKRERVPAGTSIVREGQPIDSLFILLDGVLEVTGPGLGTDKPIRLGCGEVVGEISFVDSRPPTATVTAAAAAVVLSIPRAALLEKLEQDHEFAARFYLCAGHVPLAAAPRHRSAARLRPVRARPRRDRGGGRAR